MARIIDQQKKNLIGANLRFYRQKSGYSQQQLADKLETLAVYICRGSISRIEDYSRTVTDIELVALAEILHVSVMDLLSTQKQ
ncbi:MAG: helix-turn-helix transcriptional regulator [Oscillospiraceae bacterium]|nr:helix-turn-helix transcriptional regulator [Oscillospiraceae bacterium]